MNYIDLTNGFTSSEISAMGFPSTTYEDIELEESSYQYTMPANGYLTIRGHATVAEGSNFRMYNVTRNSLYIGVYASYILEAITCFMPVCKGDKVAVYYESIDTSESWFQFRFIYANGEV